MVAKWQGVDDVKQTPNGSSSGGSMTETELTIVSFKSKAAFVQFVNDLLEKEENDYILTTIIRPWKSGVFSASVATRRSEVT
jgi:hypothetical protein